MKKTSNNDFAFQALVVLVIAVVLLLLTGCTTEVRIPEKQYIPVRCKIDKVIPPVSKAVDANDYKGIFENAIAIQTYTEVLEHDLDFCITGNIKEAE